MKRATRHLKKGERDRARDALRSALDLFPGSLEADDRGVRDLLLQAAAVAAALDGSVKVAKLLRAYLKQEPRDSQAYAALSQVLLAAQKDEDALAVCDEGLARLHGSDSLRLLKADVLRRLDRTDEALVVLWSIVQEGEAWREALTRIADLEEPTPRHYAVRGSRLEGEGDASGALASFQEALDADPRHVDALEGRARVFLANGAYDEAAEAIQETLTIESTRATVWEMKARLEVKRGEEEEAIRSLQVTLRYDPRQVASVVRLGNLLHRAGRDQEALEYYQSCSDRARDDEEYLEGWREALATLELWEGYRLVTNRLATAHPDRFIYRVDTARSWYESGEGDKAEALLLEVLENGSDDAALRRAGELALRMAAWDLARRAAEATLRAHPDDRTGLRCLALALRGLDRNAAALKVVNRGVRLYGDVEFLQVKRDILQQADDPKELFRCGEAILRLTPDDVDVYLELASLAVAQGKPRRATRVCERGLKAVPGSLTLLLKKAELLQGSERFGEAYRIYDEVLAAEPENAAAWKGRGHALFALRDFQGGATAYARAAELGDDPESWYRQGLCLQRSERLEEALEAFDRAVAGGGEGVWWIDHGICLQEAVRFREALHSYEQALGADASLDRARLGATECLLELEDPREGLRVLESASGDPAYHHDLLLARIRCLERLGEFQEALETAVAFTGAYPTEAQGWMARARFARSLGLTTESRLSWSEAARRMPRDPAPKVEEAFMLLELGEAEGALRLSDEAMALDRRNERAALARAQALVALGNQEAALRAFDATLALQPGMDEAIRGRALSFVRSGKSEEALRDMKELETKHPADAQTCLWKAQILAEAGRWEEALQAVNQALHYGGGTPETLAAKGRVLGELNRAEEGIRLLRGEVSGDSPDPLLTQTLAILLIRETHYEEALEFLDPPSGTRPPGREADLLRAEALGGLGRWDDAWDVLTPALRAGPLPSSTWIRLSALYEQQADGAGAIACYERALGVDPRDPGLWKGQGRLYAQEERWTEALESLRMADDLGPEDEEVLTWLGQAYTEVDLFDEGLEAYDRALLVNPASGSAAEGREGVEERRHARRVEGYAFRVLQFELTHERSASKEEAFRYCDVPMELLPDVLRYVNEPAPLDILSLDEGEIRTLEARSRDVLVRNEGTGLPRLAEVVHEFPEMPPVQGRRVLEYIQGVVETDLPQEDTPGLERLMKIAMELPEQDRETLILARELGVGAHQAKMIELALQNFEETSSRVRRPTTRAPAGPATGTRCRKHGTEGVYQHLCGQYLCSACIVGGRCPICRHPVSATLSQIMDPSEEDLGEP